MLKLQILTSEVFGQVVQKLLDWGAEVNQMQIDTEVCVSESPEHCQRIDMM